MSGRRIGVHWESRGDGSGEVHWSIGDDWALEEAVVRARMGLFLSGLRRRRLSIVSY